MYSVQRVRRRRRAHDRVRPSAELQGRPRGKVVRRHERVVMRRVMRDESRYADVFLTFGVSYDLGIFRLKNFRGFHQTFFSFALGTSDDTLE